MKILIFGTEKRIRELKHRLPEDAELSTLPMVQGDAMTYTGLDAFDVIFDLCFDENPAGLRHYANLSGIPVFVSAVKQQLAKAVYHSGLSIECSLIGMNCLPTFIDRDKVEVSMWNNKDEARLKEICEKLYWEPLVVEDRVGMVTPRVVFMIINEACYTLQEGTAGITDIDTSMKLGTNYPGGPFEWADKIGLRDIVETLEALYEDTREERYKVCPLLKTMYLRQSSFYQATGATSV